METTIGERIRDRRGDKGWSLPRLAKEAGVAKGYLWEVETDPAARPSVATLFKVAKALGTTVADLLGERVTSTKKRRVPKSLQEFADKRGLSDEDIQMLAGIRYRGRRPKAEEDWSYLLESIRRSVQRRVNSRSLKHARQRRTWKTAEARSLSESTGMVDPVAAIRKRVDNLLEKSEQTGPPVDLRVLASIQDIAEIEYVAIKEAGRLVPSDGSLLMQVRADDPEGRRNFTIAHEIAHTLFPAYSAEPVSRLDTTVGTFSKSDEVEYLCDVAASALMFPASWFAPRAQELGTKLTAITSLADEFSGSLEATALAWSQLDIAPAAVVFWELSLKPAELRLLNQATLPGFEETKPDPKFRVTKSFRSSLFLPFVPRHKSADHDSVVARAFLESNAKGELTLQLKRSILRIRCEASYVPYKRNGVNVPRVMTLLEPLS